MNYFFTSVIYMELTSLYVIILKDIIRDLSNHLKIYCPDKFLIFILIPTFEIIHMKTFLTGSNPESAICHNLHQIHSKDKINIKISQCGTKNSKII